MAFGSQFVAKGLAEVFLSRTSPSTLLLESLKSQLDGAEVLGLAVTAGEDNASSGCVATALNLNTGQTQSCVLASKGKVAKQSLTDAVMSSGKGFVCHARHLEAFSDAQIVLQETKCTYIACLPLIDASSIPLGCLIVGYISAPTPLAARAATKLSQDVSQDVPEILKAHARELVSSLLPKDGFPIWPFEVDQLYSLAESESSSDDFLPPCASSPDHEYAAPEHLPLPLMKRVGSILGPLPDADRLWLTFTDVEVEKRYLKWSAVHTATLDLAAMLLVLANMVTLGLMPAFGMAWRHPFYWAAGFLTLAPLPLRILPSTNHFYLQHREMAMLFVHLASGSWQQATRNSTLVLGTELFKSRSLPIACFSWQILNVLMFQLRWKWLVAIASGYFLVNAGTLLPMLCSQWGPMAGEHCVAAAAVRCVGTQALALLVLRMNEQRMRRIFLQNNNSEKAQVARGI